MNRYLLNTPYGDLLIILEGEARDYFLINRPFSYKIVPCSVKEEGSVIVFITAGFMDAGQKEILRMERTDAGLLCTGAIADYGAVTGSAVPYEGLTPYEEMVKTLKERGDVKIPDYSDSELIEKAEKLLSQMTLKEKIGQMSQSSGEDVSEIGEKIESKPMIEQIKDGEVGSVIYIGYSPEAVYACQKAAIEHTRLGIPLLICQDVVHGFQTILPVPLAQSCSFDMELIRKGAAEAAEEASAAGIMCAYAPMLDLSRDPRWGRVCEGPGEDPYLGAQIAKAVTEGYQGRTLNSRNTVAACLKHFIGYSACEGGRDYNTTEISDYTLYNMYLPAFKSGIDAGAAMVMSAFTFLNGCPVTANREILYDLLRKKLGFDGVLITDYAAVKEVGVHGCGKDDRDMVQQVLNASVDIEMATEYYNYYLEDLVKSGIVPEAAVDEAVKRILMLKYRLGIMDDPYRYIQPEKAERVIYSQEHLKTSEKLAAESIVLLKNNGILPLEKNKKVALIGPFADSADMLGSWQFSNYGEQTVTIRAGLENEGFTILYEEGCSCNDVLENGFLRAYEAACEADVVILSLGESSGETGEAASKCAPVIPAVQKQLFKEVKKAGKPVILTLTNGRPLILDDMEKDADALLETWFLGSMAGSAIAEVISGRVSPSGKLSMSFPRQTGQIPVYYNHYRTGRPNYDTDNRFTSRYLDEKNVPLYPFGYGLTYGNTMVTRLRTDTGTLTGDGTLTVSVCVKNTGERCCTEVVQLYLSNPRSKYARPVKELKKFCRTEIGAGCETEVMFEIKKEDLQYFSSRGEILTECGKYVIMAGLSSRDEDILKTEFEYAG